MQKIDERLAGFQPKSTLKRVRQDLKKAILPELQDSVATHAAYPQYPYTLPPSVIYLLVGITEGRPWVLEIERDGRDTLYGESFGHFYAIGSGKPWALACMRPHLFRKRQLEHGKVFAYKALEDSIELASGGLAKPIHMLSMSTDGSMSSMTNEEEEALRQTCETWRSLEREAVGRLFGEQSEDYSNVPPPPSPPAPPSEQAQTL